MLLPPGVDLRVVPGKQDLGNGPAPELRRARVVRVLEAAAELLGEALELAGALRERAREAPRDRVDEHHRREVAVREDVPADRDRVRAQVLDDSRVESLEARGEQRQRRQLGELLDDRLRE